MEPKQPSGPFVATIDVQLADRMLKDLGEQGFVMTQPPHTLFSAKKKGVSCTLYQSGRLVVQGSAIQEFIEFYLEPHILKNFAFTYQETDINTTPHIGVDESGKGDFFGPLCIAGVFAQGAAIVKLKSLGVKDSKGLSDAQIAVLAKKIRAEYAHHIVKINPAKYNELYPQFKNLNKLLGWGHATVIEQLMEATGCPSIIIDQFADESVVLTALSRKKLMPHLTQRHRAEEDLVVAAASILARDAFLTGLEQLGRTFEMPLPKGASQQVIKTGQLFVRRHGFEALAKVGKLHFKTLESILNPGQSTEGE